MTVIEMRERGGLEVLELGTRPVPDLQPHEVLIKVTAAGINGPDLVQRRGHYPRRRVHRISWGLKLPGKLWLLATEIP